MDNTEYRNKVLIENQSLLVNFNNRLGMYLNARDMQGFQILSRTVNQIIDARQQELLIRSQNDHGNSLESI